jgi:phage terminase large subunit
MEIEIFPKVSQLVGINLQTDKKIIVHSGGTSSGKTYSILQTFILLGLKYPGAVFTIVGQDIPNLRVGAYRDFQGIVYDNEDIVKVLSSHNRSERVFELDNGSIFEFNSYDNFQDAKSGKRDFLFVNEANGVKYDVFEELQIRTSKQVFIDFNPTNSFWAHDKLQGRSDVLWVNSNFNHNPFIDPSVREKILQYEPTPENKKRGTANDYRWKVYGLGKIGKLEGLVFPEFKVVSEMPNNYKKELFGMDFGYSNDPTTLIEVRISEGEMYLRELIYKRGLTNPDIAKELERLEFSKGQKIKADSAEPKSIEELKRMGWWVIPADKGRDSINFGIDIIKQYPINIHFQSKNLIEEFNSYMWAKDRDGRATNKPIDKFNHGIDAIRYAVEDLSTPGLSGVEFGELDGYISPLEMRY